MIIIAGYTRTEADKRDAAFEALADIVERARKYDGCLDLSISADSVDPGRINIFECWRDQRSLDAWRKVANPPKVVRRETCVKLYRGDKGRGAVLRRSVGPLSTLFGDVLTSPLLPTFSRGKYWSRRCYHHRPNLRDEGCSLGLLVRLSSPGGRLLPAVSADASLPFGRKVAQLNFHLESV